MEEDQYKEHRPCLSRTVHVLNNDRPALECRLSASSEAGTHDKGTYEHPEQRKDSLLAPILRTQITHVPRFLARSREMHGERGLRPARHSSTQRARRSAQTQRDNTKGRVSRRYHVRG